jgi:MFS family permease
MQEELKISLQAWGWVVGVFAIAYGAFEIPSGSLGDRIGARRVLTRIVCWWSAFTCLTGMVSNYYSLLLTRFCFGMGEAGAYPTTATSISRWFPRAERGGAFGIVWMASQAGAALSPLLVVPIQMRYGWRASFFLFGMIGMAWCAVWYLWYRDNPGDKPAITRQELDEIGIAPMPHGDRQPWRALFRNGNLWAVMTLALAYCYGMYFFISWLPTYLAKGRGFRENELVLSTVPFVLGALANGCGGFASDLTVKRLGLKWGRRATGIAGLSAAAIFMLAAAFTPNNLLALALLGLSYAGITFQQPAVWAVCLDVGGRHAGTVSGSMNTAAQLGSFLLSISFGYLATLSGGFNLPLIVVASVLGLGAVLWLKIDPTRCIGPQRSDTARTAVRI